MSGMTMSGQLPDPRLRKVYRLEVTIGEPLDLGQVARGHRLNNGVFISVGARQANGVLYETYLVE
jgi:hypothetical protein